MLCHFWSSNPRGYCEAATCVQVKGDLEHLLVSCPALQDDRDRLYKLWLHKSVDLPPLHDLLSRIMTGTAEEQVKFILNPNANTEVIALVQLYGQPILNHIMYLTRTIAYNLHRKKLILTGRWQKWQKVETKGSSSKRLRYVTNNSIFTGHPSPAHQPPSSSTASNTTTCSNPADLPNTNQLLPDPIPVLVPVSQPHISNVTSPDPAVSGVSSWGCGVPGDTGQSAALDYTGGAMGYSSEGRAGVGHSSQNTSYTDSHNVVALSSPACNTNASVGHHGRVVQLSSSYHIKSHHHQGPDIQ